MEHPGGIKKFLEREMNSQNLKPGPSSWIPCQQIGITSKTVSLKRPIEKGRGIGGKWFPAESQDSFFAKNQEDEENMDPEELHREKSIKLLESLPKDIEPEMYFKDVQGTTLLNTQEDYMVENLMKRQLAEASFNTKSKKFLPMPSSYELLPLSGRKSSSKSVPGTPVQPLLIQEYKKAKQSLEQKQQMSSITKQTLQMLKPESTENGSRVEAAFIQLSAAVQHANEFQSKGLGQSSRMNDPLILIRSLCKKVLQLVDSAKYDVTVEQEKTILQAVAKITELSEECSVDMKEMGVSSLVIKLVDCLVHVSSDCIMGLKRGNLVHAVFGAMKSIKMRLFLLQILCNSIMGSYNHIRRAAKVPSGEDFDQVSALFRFFQLMEFVVRTTSEEPWIDEDILQKMISLETVSFRALSFANIQIFAARVVAYGKNFGKPLRIGGDQEEPVQLPRDLKA